MPETGVAPADIARMRGQLFFEGPERNRRLSRFWLLLPLSAVIASAGVVSDSTATVIGAMIVAPLMTPTLTPERHMVGTRKGFLGIIPASSRDGDLCSRRQRRGCGAIGPPALFHGPPAPR
jgi:hypothetical protein